MSQVTVYRPKKTVSPNCGWFSFSGKVYTVYIPHLTDKSVIMREHHYVELPETPFSDIAFSSLTGGSGVAEQFTKEIEIGDYFPVMNCKVAA